MCGIAGFSLAHKTNVDATRLARELTLGIEVRGPHATGVAWTENDETWYDKAPITARKYVRSMPIGPLATQAILHTRFATGGWRASPKVNNNNHPFALPGVTGIHNGVIRSSCVDAIWSMLNVEPTTGTDSEAIFALLAYSGMDRLDALSMIDGDAAVAWIETEDPDVLHLARLSGRPLTAAQTVTGAFLFSSTDQTMRDGVERTPARITWQEEVPEWTYLRVRSGVITDVERFAPKMTRRKLISDGTRVARRVHA